MSVRWTLMAVSAMLAVVCVFMICDADGSDADPAPNQCGDNLYWSMSGGCATFTGSGDMWDYTPDVVRGWKACSSVILPNGLTKIGELAFSNCLSLESVTISNSVTSIGDGAFSNCISLESVTIPDSVTSIGETAFYGCSSLASVTIGNSVTSIGETAFYGCSSLASVTIPDSVTSIGYKAFAVCTSLVSIIVDEGNENYSSEDGVLFNKNKTMLVQCPGGKEGGYSIPASVTSIGNRAFYVCPSLESVTIGNSVTSIGENAFSDCTSLESVTIGNSVTSIGDYAFWNCTSLISVTIGNSVTSIGENAFEYCTSLASVTIPDSVTSIRDYAFEYCTSLASVTIPDSVTSIANGAFYLCYNLSEVNVVCSNPLNITEGETSNGHVAYYASNVNLYHTYSATYTWADDGSTCTVDIACSHGDTENHKEHPEVAHTVKIPPTETEMGTTAYSVSGTYDGFTYSDTKDVKDIPATGKPGGSNDSTLLYIAAGGAFAALALIGGAFFLLRKR